MTVTKDVRGVKVYDQSDEKIVGKTIKEIVTETYLVRIVFDDGTRCEISSSAGGDVIMKCV